MANKVFTTGLEKMAGATFDWDNAGVDVNCALMTTGYTFDDDHLHYDHISANEVSDASYTAGGNTVANKAITRDAANDWVELDCDDVVFTSLDNVTIGSVIFYLDSGVGTTSWLLSYHDDAVNFPLTANGGNVTIGIHGDGVVKLAST